MLDIIVRVTTVDMDGFNGREHHPTKEMEGQFVRVTNLECISAEADEGDKEGMDADAHASFHILYGILVDANGEDVEGGEVELIEHEIETLNNMPVLFSSKRS